MVKGWVGAAGRGFVGAAPLFEAGPLPGNWSYANVPGLQPILDAGDLTHNLPTSFNRGASNWAYNVEPTIQPILDQGLLTHNLPTGMTHGWSTDPYNSTARGLGLQTDEKIKKPWLWP